MRVGLAVGGRGIFVWNITDRQGKEIKVKCVEL